MARAFARSSKPAQANESARAPSKPLRHQQALGRSVPGTASIDDGRSPATVRTHQLAGEPACRPCIPAGHELARIRMLPTGRQGANGRLEVEADRVADGMMRPIMTPEYRPPGSPRTNVPRAPSTVEGSAALHTLGLQGGGERLSNEMRGFFEPAFGHDFSHVRVHAGQRAARVARSLGARAFATGPDIVFAAGAYSPGTQQGRWLLAHELAHVVQQNSGLSDSGEVQRKPEEEATNDTFLINLPDGGIHLKVKPYADADNFPGDKAENDDTVTVKNTGGAATYRNVKNGTWSWIEIPGKSSPDPKYPVLHGFIPNKHIAGLVIGPVESAPAEEAEQEQAETEEPEKPPEKTIPETCPESEVDDAKVQSYIDSAIAHAAVSGGFDVEKAFEFLQAKRCVEDYCCDQDLAAAEHYMFSRYMVYVEGYALPVWAALVLGYAGAKGMDLVPSLCQCPVTPATWAQISWALSGAADGESDAFMRPPSP
jgi:hypothetical protein